MSVRENARIVERARKPIECSRGGLCSMLTEARRCGVYDIRPMVCRIWGAVRKMKCPYGCTPERWLTDAEAVQFMVEAERIGGSPRGDRQQRIAEKLLASMTEEELAAMGAEIMLRAEPATLTGRRASRRVWRNDWRNSPGVGEVGR